MSDFQDDIELKLSAARTRLIIEKPFLGALVLRLPMVAALDNWCPTTATDARKIFYNPEYIKSLDLDETQFMLAHEALHCALSHFARRGNRDKCRWDIACDLAINPLLISEGFKLPKGALLLDGYDGMTAEEIYPTIQKNFEEQPLDKHVYDDGEGGQSNTDSTPLNKLPEDKDKDKDKEKNKERNKPSKQPPLDDSKDNGQARPQPESSGKNNIQNAQQPPPLTPTEKETLDTQWQQRLAGAAQQAMQAGKMGGAMARLVDYLLQPQLPWRHLLAHYVTAIARDDYSYTRPSSRRGDPAIYPSLRSGQASVVVALDTSGSISDEELASFLSEINALKSTIRARVTLQACDSELKQGGPWIFEPWEEFELPEKFEGGGGTSFCPIFDWAEKMDIAPQLLIYFTDAKGKFPDHEPTFPVLWLVKGKTMVPWGTRIQLN